MLRIDALFHLKFVVFFFFFIATDPVHHLETERRWPLSKLCVAIFFLFLLFLLIVVLAVLFVVTRHAIDGEHAGRSEPALLNLSDYFLHFGVRLSLYWHRRFVLNFLKRGRLWYWFLGSQ